MIVWIKAAASGAKCDQRAEFLELVAGLIRVKFCGDDVVALVSPDEICGIEFRDDKSDRFISILFEMKGWKGNIRTI